MGRSPNFLIIGERRSGTTTLARWMKEHPQIFLHPKMDIGYFVDDELVGNRSDPKEKIDFSKWHRTHSKSAYELLFSAATNHTLVGEKSADYLFLEQCHKRIKDFYPDIKLLITLRNPVDRAWSMYWNEVGKGRESLSFEEAIEAETARISESDYAMDHLSYFHRGLYAQSLKKLFKLFSPQQVCVVFLEEAKENPQLVMQRVYNFLEVDPKQGMKVIGQTFNRNWTVEPKGFVKNSKIIGTLDIFYYRFLQKLARIVYRDTYARRRFVVRASCLFREKKATNEMKPDTRAMLEARYAPHTRSLEKLLDININWW